MLLIIFISQKFCVVKSVHVYLSYIVPQIYINMHEIWINVGMLKKYYNICIWYIIYNQYSIITDIFRSLYLFYPFCPLNPYLTSKTRVGRVFAKKPGFLPSLVILLYFVIIFIIIIIIIIIILIIIVFHVISCVSSPIVFSYLSP